MAPSPKKDKVSRSTGGDGLPASPSSTPGHGPALAPGIRRIVVESHRNTTERPARMTDPVDVLDEDEGTPTNVVQEDHRIPEVRPEELEGHDWLPALFWHHPEEAPFPGDYAVVAQPFTAGPSQTGFQDHQGRPLTYLVLFVMGAVAPGAALPPELLRAAFQDTLVRATRLAKGLSQEMHDATVRLLLVRMPEWMARKLVPSLHGVRKV